MKRIRPSRQDCLDLQRFQNKIRKDDKTGCWLWEGSYAHKLPVFQFNGTWTVRSLMKRPKENQMTVATCGHLYCVNPDHLRCIPRSQAIKHYRAANRDTERCMRGHLFTEENTYNRPDGTGRTCKACRQIRIDRDKEKKGWQRRGDIKLRPRDRSMAVLGRRFMLMPEQIIEKINKLEPNERDCLLYYWGADGEPKTIEEIMELMDLSSSRVRYHKDQGMQNLYRVCTGHLNIFKR